MCTIQGFLTQVGSLPLNVPLFQRVYNATDVVFEHELYYVRHLHSYLHLLHITVSLNLRGGLYAEFANTKKFCSHIPRNMVNEVFFCGPIRTQNKMITSPKLS